MCHIRCIYRLLLHRCYSSSLAGHVFLVSMGMKMKMKMMMMMMMDE